MQWLTFAIYVFCRVNVSGIFILVKNILLESTTRHHVHHVHHHKEGIGRHRVHHKEEEKAREHVPVRITEETTTRKEDERPRPEERERGDESR